MQSTENVIQSALKLAQRKGWENVSVRMIAKEIGYSTMKIYSDFGSKEQLLYEIQKRGFDMLRSAYEKALDPTKAPESNLETMVIAHVRFALDRSVLYELMFDHKFNHCKTDAAKIKQEVCGVFLEVIEAIGVAKPETAFLQLFAMLYGYVKISKEFSNQNDNLVETTISQLVKNFVYGIK
jgi:AcrR family transcriptional regulator